MDDKKKSSQYTTQHDITAPFHKIHRPAERTDSAVTIFYCLCICVYIYIWRVRIYIGAAAHTRTGQYVCVCDVRTINDPPTTFDKLESNRRSDLRRLASPDNDRR